jgi:hypothetical protein
LNPSETSLVGDGVTNFDDGVTQEGLRKSGDQGGSFSGNILGGIGGYCCGPGGNTWECNGVGASCALILAVVSGNGSSS